MNIKLAFIAYALIISVNMFSQRRSGNLLLLRIQKEQNLSIDKFKTYYLIIELDSINKPLKSTVSTITFFQGFTDRHLALCINNDSIQLKTLLKGETFVQENENGFSNLKKIEKIKAKMKELIKINLTSPKLYTINVKIDYVLVNCSYCIGSLDKYAEEFMDYKEKVALIIDNLKIDTQYKIPKDEIYDIVKVINFNSLLW